MGPAARSEQKLLDGGKLGQTKPRRAGWRKTEEWRPGGRATGALGVGLVGGSGGTI